MENGGKQNYLFNSVFFMDFILEGCLKDPPWISVFPQCISVIHFKSYYAEIHKESLK